MVKRLIAFFTFVIILGFSFQSIAQLTQEELAERGKWEKFLRTAKIIKGVDIGEGITKPKRLFFKKGDIEGSGVWKRPSGTDAGVFDKWECEIAAYEMDKLLGLNMVPPTVERRYRGRKGSVQLWFPLEISELERLKQDIPIPPDKLESCEKAIYLHRAFDSLIANSDRTLQNIRYTKDWRLILIDHSRAFRSSRFYTDKLIYGKYGSRKDKCFERLPRAFVEKIKSLDFEKIRKAVDFYLTYSEIEAILIRKKLLLKEINEMIKEKGEDQVLY